MLSIKKPTLVLNPDICRENIRNMAGKAREHQVKFRPHFKTHQSAATGEWFRDEGVTAITVSSVSMAQYFAKHGWKDITIAFPLNIHEIDEINSLAAEISLYLLIESTETALLLSEKLTANCGYFIKIDTGYHRTGIEASNDILIDKVLNAASSAKLSFKGFLVHNGNAYQAKNREELIRIQQETTAALLRLKKKYQQLYPDMIVSVGDTPICSQLLPAGGIDEIRPGNFVFFDLMQFALGSCMLEEIAVALVCPVVAVHQSRKEAVIYGGAVHLSKEQALLPPDQDIIYGLAVSWDGKNWDCANALGKVSRLSQEHGIVALNQNGCNLKPGDMVAILPVHSCLTAHAMKEYYTPNGEHIDTMNL